MTPGVGLKRVKIRQLEEKQSLQSTRFKVKNSGNRRFFRQGRGLLIPLTSNKAARFFASPMKRRPPRGNPNGRGSIPK
jgi:hypothetical protein